MKSSVLTDSRSKHIADYFEKNPERLITSTELCDAVFHGRIKLGTFRAWIQKSWTVPQNVEVVPRKGYVYHPSEPKAEVAPEVKPVTKEKPLENAEGYSDPTAGRALQSLEPTLPYASGELWSAETRLGESEMLLIVAATKGRVTALKVWTEKKSEFSMPIRIFYCGKFYWTDPSEITWRSPKSLMKNHHSIRTQEFEFAKQALGKYLGTVVATEVVKEVPKIQVVTQTVEKQDPKMAQELKEARAEIARLKEELAKAPKTEESGDILVLKAQLATFREIFAMMYPERRTADEG